MEALPNSIHLVAPATAHNVAPQGCAAQLMEQLIDQGNLEGIDGDCLQELKRPSFFVKPSGPSIAGPEITQDPEATPHND